MNYPRGPPAGVTGRDSSIALVSWVGADPAGEFEELVGIYEAKGLNPGLARQVAEALTELDPAAAHADAELRLEALGPTSGTVLAALIAGLCFGIGAVIPLAAMIWLPRESCWH